MGCKVKQITTLSDFLSLVCHSRRQTDMPGIAGEQGERGVKAEKGFEEGFEVQPFEVEYPFQT